VICVSTRGGAPDVGFIDAMLGGLAPDGGLYVPKGWPRIPRHDIAGFAGRPYAEVATAILKLFTDGDLASGVVERLCEEAYAGFDHPAVAPLVQLAPGLFLLELFHGPSLAFKDIAMQLLARLYDHVLVANGSTATIVCATSGDTGGAAVEAFRGLDSIRLVILFPENRISERQRRFMTTSGDANIHVAAVDGDFDDCQALLKSILADRTFANAGLAAVNSINLARIVAQTVYYFTAAAALGSPERPVTFAVPTGNFGDAYAGYAATAMGLPVERLVVATNSNDIVARALEAGRYQRGSTKATLSPAMDIQVASNFERFWFGCSGRNANDTAVAFRAFAASGSVDIPPPTHRRMRELLGGVAITEAQTLATMRATFEGSGVIVDPHTAVALASAQADPARDSRTPVVVLSTAHAAKFPQAVRSATGIDPPPPPRIKRLETLPEAFDRLPAELEAVKAYVRAAAA